MRTQFSDVRPAVFISRLEKYLGTGLLALALFALPGCNSPGSGPSGPTTQGIRVRNAGELLERIGPDRTLLLEAGDYRLPQSAPPNHPHVRAHKVFDGYEIVLTNIKNLTLRAATGGPRRPRLLARPRYANVLTFENSSGIRIEGIVAGHSPEPGSCVGGVLLFRSSRDITLRDLDLFGSGTEGLTLEDVQHLSMRGSRIRECTYGILSMTRSRDVSFLDSRFDGNREYDLINIRGSERVVFDSVRITGNRTGLESYSNYALFHLQNSREVELRESVIQNNTTLYFQKYSGEALRVRDTKLANNRFERGIDAKIR